MSRSSSELAHLFRAMKAPAAARALPKLAERARQEEWSYERFAEALFSTELSSRESSGGRLRIRAARFPAHKTLEEFDFTFQRSVKKQVIEHLGQLDFLHAKQNVILLGPPDHLSHCPPDLRHFSNSPASGPVTLIRRPFRRPLTTWTASSSPCWTLCKTVCRAQPRRFAASSNGR
jgi:IstB-like ATP binding protein